MKKHLLRSFPIIIIAAVLANVLWLVEILNVSGWNGTSWINVQQKSIIAICALAALAYIFPLWQNEGAKRLTKDKVTAFWSCGLFFLLIFILEKLS